MQTIEQELLQRGREEGREEQLHEGKVEATRQYIADLLQLRLDVPRNRYAGRLEQIDDLEQLRLLLREAALATDVAAFEAALVALQLNDG